MIHVFYHAKCHDGFGAAYAAWLTLKDTAEYHPVSYGEEVPVVTGEVVYIVDFSYSEESLKFLHNSFNKIVILDHHKTAEEMLKPLIGKYDWLEIQFDMERSGALMTWDYFNSKDDFDFGMTDHSRKALIEHISDRDLWKFEHPDTKAVHMGLKSYPMDFEVWDDLAVGLDSLIDKGKTLLDFHAKQVSDICDNAFFKDFCGFYIPCVNTSMAWSEVGAELIRRNPLAPFVMTFTEFMGHTMVSLRSCSKYGVDVSEIAKQYDGGGHRNAAGFKIPRSSFWSI